MSHMWLVCVSAWRDSLCHDSVPVPRQKWDFLYCKQIQMVQKHFGSLMGGHAMWVKHSNLAVGLNQSPTNDYDLIQLPLKTTTQSNNE